MAECRINNLLFSKNFGQFSMLNDKGKISLLCKTLEAFNNKLHYYFFPFFNALTFCTFNLGFLLDVSSSSLEQGLNFDVKLKHNSSRRFLHGLLSHKVFCDDSARTMPDCE